MPFSTEFVDNHQGLLFVGSGVVTADEILDAKGALLDQETRLRRIRHAMVLLADVTDLRVTTDEIRQLARIDERLAKVTSNVVVAVVAANDLTFGLARMWEVLADSTGWKTAVFRTRSEAETWLRAILASPVTPPRGGHDAGTAAL